MRKWKPLASIFDQGAWLSVVNMIPHLSGSYVTPPLYTQKTGAGPATPGTTLRAWCALLPSDTAIGYVGTSTKLYEYATTDRSKGGGYTATDWSFAQYGNITIATDRTDAVQSRDATTANAFADLAGSPPKATIVVTQAESVLLFDLNDGAEKPDAFAASAPGDHTDWSGATATTATRIRHRPGKIVAAVAFQDYVLAFKRSSVYKITYTGGTFKWRVELIAVNRGAWNMHSVVNCGDVVVFVGPGGRWLFDGASFRNVGDYLDDYTASTAPKASFYESGSRNVWFVLSAASANVYNLVSDAWGHWAGCSTSAALASTYRPFTGEPAALSSFSTSAGTDNSTLPWLVDYSSNPSVVESDTPWGGGSASNVASLTGSAAGPGMGAQTKFTRLRLLFSPTFNEVISNYATTLTFPTATELALTLYAMRSPVGTITAPVDGLASSSEERRFDFLVSTGHVIPKVSIGADDGYCPILDYAFDSIPDGAIV